MTEKIALSMGRQAVQSATSSLRNTSKPKIDWNNFNFPPLIHIIHFSLGELEPKDRSIVLKIYITLWIIFSILFISIINSIIQTAQGHPGLRIFYAFLNFFIFLILHFYLFNRGYKGIVKDDSLLFLFKIMIGLVAIAYLVFSIIGAGAFNGWVRVGDFWNNESPDGKG